MVGRNFLRLAAGETVARGIAFISTIYLARTLGAAMYGVIGVAAAILLYFNRIADAEFDLVGAREISQDPAALDRIGASVVTARLVIGAALAIVLGVTALLVLPQPDGTVLAVYSLTLLAVAGSTRWIHLGLGQTAYVAGARVAGAALMLFLLLVLVHDAGDVARVPLSALAGDALAALLLMWLLTRRGFSPPVALHWDVVRPVFQQSAPLVLSALLGLLVYNADLIFLRFLRGETTAGYYAAAYMVVSLAVNLGLTYRLSLLPTMTRLASTGEQQRELYHTATAHVFAAVFPVALGGFLLGPRLIEVVFGAEFRPAASALTVLIWSVPLTVLRDVPIVALVAGRQEKRILRLQVWSAAINILLNLLLIPRFGMLGAAWATVTTEAVRLVLALLLVRRDGYRLTSGNRFWRTAVAGATMAASLMIVRSAGLWIALPLGAAVYLITLAMVGGIRLRRGALPGLTV